MSSPGINVTLFDTHARVPNGLGSFKNITLQDFSLEVQRVCAGTESAGTPKVSFRLPNEAVSVRSNANEMDLIMYFEGAKREIRYGNAKYNAAMPPIVIFCTLKSNGKGGWAVENVKWFATDYTQDEIPNREGWDPTPRQMSNHLWILPFPNQYGDGGMCVGSNSYRSLYTHDLRGLSELYYHILIASPFNDDLWSSGQNKLSSHMNARTWFQMLVREETFPLHMLPGYPAPANAAPIPENDSEEDEDDEDDE